MTQQAELPVIPDDQYDRRQYIGSSNAAAILGLGATYDGVQQTAVTVYNAKTAPAEQVEQMDPGRKKFLERRKRWEPVVVQMLREEFMAEVVATNRRYRHPTVPYLAAEVDFEWVAEDGTVQNGEIKTVSPRAFSERQGWGEPGTGDIPVHYEAQVQFALMVTGRRESAVCAMVGLDSMLFYRVVANPVVQEQMMAKCVAFWTNHVLAKVAPEAQTITDLHLLYPTSNGLAVESTSDIGSKALRLRAVRSHMEALEFESESLEYDIKNALRNYEQLLVDGKKVFVWKEQSFSRLDQTAIKENEKAIYKKYLLTGKHRTFKMLKGD